MLPDSFVVSKNIKIHNNVSSLIQISGIVFTVSESLVNNVKLPIVIQKNSIGYSQLKEIFSLIYNQEIKEKNIELLNSSLLESIFLISRYPHKFDCKLHGKIDQRLIIVNRTIRKHYNDPLTLEYLAGLIECTPPYLSFMYKKVFNISPIKFLQAFRMKKSLDIIINSELSIGEIANKIGYVSQSQFTSIFNKYFGISPSSYRNLMKGKKKHLY